MYIYPHTVSQDDPVTSVVSWESWDTQTHGVGDVATMYPCTPG